MTSAARAPRPRIPQPVDGSHQSLRRAAAVFLSVTFFSAPWVSVDGRPLVRLDFTSGRFFLFAQPIPTTEAHHFVFLLLPLGLALFLASSLLGRIWCGYACPQTVFVDLGARAIDAFVEGPPEARRKRDRQGRAWPVAWRRAVRHAAYAGVALLFAFHLVALFSNPVALLSGARPVASSVGGVFALLAYVDAAFLRQKFCALMCPYARFQSLLVDPGTRQIGYDAARGEPRGRKAEGSCVDCGLCVRVCPAGIDIRDGFNQLECYNCARCLDACDQVMHALDRGPGLIRYETETRARATSPVSRPEPVPLWRPRTTAYATAIVGLLAWGAYDFLARPPFRLQALNLTPTGYVVEDNRVKALVRVRVSNLTGTRESYRFELAREAAGEARIETAPPGAPVEPGGEGNALLLVSFPRTEPRAAAGARAIVLEAVAETQGARRAVEIAIPRPSP